MRLWHKDLISVLPSQQLLDQWLDCCLIAKNIAEKGTPNHILVNRIMDYPLRHLYNYGVLISKEMDSSGYKCEFERFSHWFTYPHETGFIQQSDIYKGWHNNRYFEQCFYNLQEKYDCGGISEEEWAIIGELLHDRFVDLYIKKRGKG